MIEMCSLGSVVDVSAGQPAPKANEFANDGKPFIRAGSLESLLSGRSLSECEKVTKVTAEKNRLRLYPRDTIVFAKSGMSATLGRVYRLSEPAYVVSHLAALVPTGDYDPGYLTYWLRGKPPSHLIKDPAYPSIRVSEIEELQVPNVPLQEQQRISTILDKADSIRRKREQMFAMADELLKSVFQHMFGNLDANPKNYKIREFASLLAIPLRNGISPSSRGDVSAEVLMLSAITGSAFDPEERKEGKFLEPIAEKDEVNSADFYICRGNGSPDLVGRGFFATASMASVAFPDTMIAARPKTDEIAPGFLETVWNSPFVRSKIVNSARTTNGTYKINQTATGNIAFPVPPLEEQARFEKIAEKVRSTQRTLSTISFGDDLFASLSQRAFRGEL